MDLPLIRPNPPRLSRLQAELIALEESGIFTNHGPIARRFEGELVETLFGGKGAALAVSNATIGLMLAIRAVIGEAPPAGRFALMPAFTFAATAHAAIWAGLTPLLCDVDPVSWLPDGPQEEALLKRHGDAIAVIVPYATFGASLDLNRYQRLSKRYDVPVVVDAAASLGTIDAKRHNFGTGRPFATVYSMHATKTFATGEGGVIYSGDAALIDRLRTMSNYGFGDPRSATMPGMNAKLSEVASLLALAKLREIDGIADHRAALVLRYRARLPEYAVQHTKEYRQAMQFMSVLLPSPLTSQRGEIIAALARAGIGAATYFSPHLAQQPYFQEVCSYGALPMSDDIGARVLALPITDGMTLDDVDRVCAGFREICAALMHPIDRRLRNRPRRMAAR